MLLQKPTPDYLLALFTPKISLVILPKMCGRLESGHMKKRGRFELGHTEKAREAWVGSHIEALVNFLY